MRSYRLSTCFRQRKHSCFVQLACWLVSYSTLAFRLTRGAAICEDTGALRAAAESLTAHQ